MAQTLENVNAFAGGQTELPVQKTKRLKIKRPTFLNNDEWNLLIQRLFMGDDPEGLAKKFDVSVKTIYGWRRQIMLNKCIAKFTLSEATKKVLRRSTLSWYDENKIFRPFVFRESPTQVVEPPREVIKQSSETLLVGPSGNQFLVEIDDPALMKFLKSEGFNLYQLIRKI